MALALLAIGGGNSAWAGDFIDDATTIKVAGTETSATSGGKKTLTFTPTGAETAIEFTFSSGKDITPGQIFGVVEYSGTGTNTGNCRFRNFTIGGTELEEGTKATQLSFTVNGNTVVLCPFLQNDVNNADKVLKTYYKTNVDAASLSLTYCRMYVGATASTEVTFKRIGIYTLGEILTLYPDLKTNNFQIKDDYRLTNDASIATNNASSKTNDGSTTGIIETKANISTLAGCKLFCKAVDFAKIPDNYRYFWFRHLVPTDESAHEDLFSGINSNAVLMLNLQSHAPAYLPTMHTRVIDFDRKMQNTTFVDGTAPGSAITVDGKDMGTTTTANWGTYSRSLKAGYNSCAMPFKKFASTSDIPAGLSFYKVASINGSGVVSFSKMSDSELTAATAFTNGDDNWTPVIIKAETAGVYTFVGRDAITSWDGITYKSKTVGGSDNKVFWVGSFVNEVPSGDYAAGENCKNYGITSTSASFARMIADTKTTYYRAFISDKRTGTSAPALTLNFTDFAGGTTDIVRLEDVHGLEVMSDGAVYNLQGVRVDCSKLPKGIYVKNGKKFVVK